MLAPVTAFYRLALAFERCDFAMVAAEGRKPMERTAATFPDTDANLLYFRYILGAGLMKTGWAAEGEPLLRQVLAADGKPGREHA